MMEVNENEKLFKSSHVADFERRRDTKLYSTSESVKYKYSS